MNELKIAVDDREAFEEKLRKAGGVMSEPYWIGNWYLKTDPQHVLKVVQAHGAYRLLELKKIEVGFAFIRDTAIEDITPYKLDEVPPESTLHKTARRWIVQGQSVDVLVFDDIGVFACVNYEDGEKQKALALIDALGLSDSRFLEVPFNVLKRRQMGLADFDGSV
jgi:hypothetical protein